jgi:hypothetical protein
MNQELSASYGSIKVNYSKYYDVMVARKKDILLLVNDFPTAFAKCYIANTDLNQLFREIERLIIETDKLFHNGALEKCCTNLENCIKTIDKIIANTEKQIGLVKSAEIKIESDTEAEELKGYEIRLSKELKIFKEFKQSLSSMKSDLVS